MVYGKGDLVQEVYEVLGRLVRRLRRIQRRSVTRLGGAENKGSVSIGLSKMETDHHI